jgi:hypothetical protein
MTAINLPNQKKISITVLANSIAQSLHPLPTEIKWAVQVSDKIIHRESGDVLEPMTEADFASLDALCKQYKLPSIVRFNELEDSQIEAWTTPYQTALDGKKWKQAWKPFFETLCNAQDPERKQHEARVEQHDELREAVQRGEIKAFDDNGRTAKDINTASILMADAVDYCENRGWDAIIVGAAPATDAAAPAPVVVAGDKSAKRKNRKPSWVVEAMPYMEKLYAAGKYRSCSVFFKALKNSVGKDDSPFTLVKDELYCDKAGTTVAESTLGNVWKAVRGQ